MALLSGNWPWLLNCRVFMFPIYLPCSWTLSSCHLDGLYDCHSVITFVVGREDTWCWDNAVYLCPLFPRYRPKFARIPRLIPVDVCRRMSSLYSYTCIHIGHIRTFYNALLNFVKLLKTHSTFSFSENSSYATTKASTFLCLQ